MSTSPAGPNGSKISSFSALLTTLVLLGSVLVLMGASPALAAEPGAEAEFVSMVNQSRAQAGLPALRSGVWVDDARTHSGQMASSGSIFHDSSLQSEADGVSSCWTKIGENVGMGGAVGEISTAFMNSPSHRANILGQYDSIGVGVVQTATGMFVTQRFMMGSSCGGGTAASSAPASATPAATQAAAAPARVVSATARPLKAPVGALNPGPKSAPVGAAPAAPKQLLLIVLPPSTPQPEAPANPTTSKPGVDSVRPVSHLTKNSSSLPGTLILVVGLGASFILATYGAFNLLGKRAKAVS